MTTVYLVRHGQASFGAADYDQLSALGQRQSELLGQWWKQTGRSIESSAMGAMKRHRQTAQACLQALGADTSGSLVDPGFNEYDHEGILRIHRPDLRDHEAVGRYLMEQAEQGVDPKRAFQRVFMEAADRWTSGAHDADYPESWPAFKQRCITATHQAAAQARERGHGSVVVFTSGGPIAAITQGALGIPDAKAFDLAWSLLNAGVTQVQSRSGSLRLAQFNNVAHLDLACDPAMLTFR